MNNIEIAKTFDKLAKNWDLNTKIDENIINTIFEKAKIKENSDILDVGCGTGVLFNYYKLKGARSITGIDISTQMVKIAQNNYPFVKVICIDAKEYKTQDKYDSIMLYDCFPHIDDKENTIKHLVSLLKENGTLTIAHSMNLEKLKDHHKNMTNVSEFVDTSKIQEIMNNNLTNIFEINNNDMYLITGTNK